MKLDDFQEYEVRLLAVVDRLRDSNSLNPQELRALSQDLEHVATEIVCDLDEEAMDKEKAA